MPLKNILETTNKKFYSLTIFITIVWWKKLIPGNK